MVTEPDRAHKQIDALLSIPHQTWLLGAGISCDAGIPLMNPLTMRIASLLEQNAELYHAMFALVREELPLEAHIEHILSHVGDLIAIADRSRDKHAMVRGVPHSGDSLRTLHSTIQENIRNTIMWGYRPENPSAGTPEAIGDQRRPIVKVDIHRDFARALFRVRRAGLDQRPPVAFFTTNYDTLLEDALALERINAADGFTGGAMAYWDQSAVRASFHKPFENDGTQAKIYKLHGSIDWYASDQDVVVRVREGVSYPTKDSNRLVIYPQATKYALTQHNPFASLFAAFREALNHDEQSLLAVCGYSFGDEHINEEIARALKQRGNRATLLIFAYQPDGVLDPDESLPPVVSNWLKSDTDGHAWNKRVIVAGRRGIYHGSMKNLHPCDTAAGHPWWSFTGVTSVLEHGMEGLA